MLITFVKWILFEMKFRKGRSFLIILSSFISVLFVSGSFLAFQLYDEYIDVRYSGKLKSLENEMSMMIKEYKKITKKLGFNVLILPKEQNMSDFYADNFASHYMPQWYADTLAQSKSILIQHILPALIQKVHWKEIKREVLIYGIKKENSRIYFPEANKKLPVLQAVNPDSIVLGYELWKSLELEVGEPVELMGHRFFISKRHEMRGNRDDITAWIDLEVSQKIFNKENQINTILALECRCDGTEDKANIINIRKDLKKILPNTQVVEFMSKVIARAEARYASVKIKKETIENEKKYVESVKQRQFIISSFVVTIALIGSIFSIIVITILDIRNRKHEIGQLLCLGFKRSYIIFLFCIPLFLLSVLGSLLAYSFSIIIINYIKLVIFNSSFELLYKNYYLNSLMISLFISAILSFIASVPIMKSVKVELAFLFREEN